MITSWIDIQVKIIDDKLYQLPEDLPKYATEGSAARDLMTTRDIILEPQATMLIGTGLAIHIGNPNYAAYILPRSGLGHKEGVVLGNLVGLIDSDYQDEVKVSLWNRGNVTRYFKRGDRIAQLVIMPVVHARFDVVTEFVTTDRGLNGWGSTGV